MLTAGTVLRALTLSHRILIPLFEVGSIPATDEKHTEAHTGEEMYQMPHGYLQVEKRSDH